MHPRRRLCGLLLVAGAILLVGLGPWLGGLAPGALPSVGSVAGTDPSGGGAAGPPPLASPGPTPPTSPAPSLAPGSGADELAVLAPALQAVLERAVEEGQIPGLSAAVRWPDGRLWVGAAGWADVAGRRPMTPSTAVALGSVSKTFVAALVLRLVADGRLSLDDRVNRWLPGLPARVLPSGVTVRMLLDHTSGIADFFANPAIDRALLAHRNTPWTPTRSLAYVGGSLFRPGRGWHYSNTNYLLLGLLVERLTGQPWGAAVTSSLLDPLGLRETFVQGGDPPIPVAHGYSFRASGGVLIPDDLSDGTSIMPFTSVVTAAGAAGGLAASAADVARWAAALYGGDVLPATERTAMVDDVRRTARLHPAIPYGLGVEELVVDGHRTYGHDGRFLGARAEMRYFVDSGVAVAVLANASRSPLLPVVTELARLLFPPPWRGAFAR